MPLQNNSNLPTIQSVKYEDYKDAPQWFAQFLMSLNLFMTAVYNIINRGITYSNLGVIAPFSFQFTPGSTTNFKFTNPITVAPTNVVIGNVYETGDLTSHPAVVVQIFWHYTNGSIVVDSLVGLTPGTTYIISVQVS